MLTPRSGIPALALALVLTCGVASASAAPGAPASQPTVVVDGSSVSLGAKVAREEVSNGSNSGSGSSGSKGSSSSGLTTTAAVDLPVCPNPVFSWLLEGDRDGSLTAEIVGSGEYYCPNPPNTPQPSDDTATKLTQAQVAALVTHLVVQLQLPHPHTQIGPDPSLNEWNMAVVGYPLWLWTTEPTTRTATLTVSGHTFTLNAHRTTTDFNLGDGTTITCTNTTPWPDQPTLGQPSPTCGHTYTHPSLPAGTYTITTTAHWTVHWTALNYTGDLTLPLTTTRTIRVGELQSLRIR